MLTLSQNTDLVSLAHPGSRQNTILLLSERSYNNTPSDQMTLTQVTLNAVIYQKQMNIGQFQTPTTQRHLCFPLLFYEVEEIQVSYQKHCFQLVTKPIRK